MGDSFSPHFVRGELSSWIPSFTVIPYELVGKISERKDDVLMKVLFLAVCNFRIINQARLLEVQFLLLYSTIIISLS